MTQTSFVILCLAYILGLLSTSTPWGGYCVLAASIGAAFTLPRFLVSPKPKIWLAAGVLGLLASFYFQVRTPQPAANDISQFVSAATKEQIVTVQGKVTSTPRLTRSQRGQFSLEATQLSETKSEDESADVSRRITGELYVTVPLLQATGLYPGQAIAVTGVLYKPKSASNPGAFNFKVYLERQGIFAGLSGREITFANEQRPQWGWWLVRQRIVRSQVRWLGSPAGPLVSSIVLGSQVVDLPYDIHDLFVQAGLAHALAASGFQTSLLLGLVLALSRRLSPKLQVSGGVGTLVIFLCLTGLQPSVLRATVMGFGALIALAMQRQVKPLGALLLTAVLLLLFNPLWIWDLGFELSFLATLGLLVTVPPLIKRLDWLPPAIATLIAVPIAAALWTLPLQLHIFGIVPVYSLVINILSTPLISVISIGGIISALLALIWPLGGSALAWLLYYPTESLIKLVEFFSQLPGNSVALGTISVLQLLALYGLISLTWLQTWWQQRWWFAGSIAIGLILIPVWHQSTVFRVTVLAAGAEPVLVIQDQGKVLLVNSGDANTTHFTVLPFLQQQGINQVDWAIATNARSRTSSGWLEILKRLPVKVFYDHGATESETTNHSAIVNAIRSHSGSYQPLNISQKIIVGSTAVQLIDTEPPILQLQVQKQTWLMLGNLNIDEQKKLALSGRLPQTQVVWWSGKFLASNLLKVLEPEVAIASSTIIAPDTVSYLRRSKIQLFWTARDGAIQWTPGNKFETTTEAVENNASSL